MRLAVLWGALSATLLTFPLAAVCAVVYRFPVPFAGYASSVAAVPTVLLAVGFYGVIGGFAVLGGAGAIAGWLAHEKAQPDSHGVRRLAIAYGALPAALAVLVLAVLDKLIGAW
jgi:hypothetical protein